MTIKFQSSLLALLSIMCLIFWKSIYKNGDFFLINSTADQAVYKTAILLVNLFKTVVSPVHYCITVIFSSSSLTHWNYPHSCTKPLSFFLLHAGTFCLWQNEVIKVRLKSFNILEAVPLYACRETLPQFYVGISCFQPIQWAT